ncbi:MAG: phosphatase PAP2-related protein [bacterium]|nr:phosphatase PAP2-related protein [bacterium]
MQLLKTRDFAISLLTGAVLFVASYIVMSRAVTYATESASNSVTDIILSNLPVYDVGGIFVWGAVVLALVAFAACLMKPERVPFVLKSSALFMLIRSFFISLTHISPYPFHVELSQNIVTYLVPSFFMGDDLFFSGHTGFPFLLALIFWDNLALRSIFIGFSLLFGTVVLLGHLHYSIDVASAFFITFTIFIIAKTLFKLDWVRSKPLTDSVQ